MSVPDPSFDAALGMAWFNGLTEYQRCLWLTRAGSDVPADAWAVFKAAQLRDLTCHIAAPPVPDNAGGTADHNQ